MAVKRAARCVAQPSWDPPGSGIIVLGRVSAILVAGRGDVVRFCPFLRS